LRQSLQLHDNVLFGRHPQHEPSLFFTAPGSLTKSQVRKDRKSISVMVLIKSILGAEASRKKDCTLLPRVHNDDSTIRTIRLG